jgi:hypothetical protein
MLTETLTGGVRWLTARAAPSWRAWLTGPWLTGPWLTGPWLTGPWLTGLRLWGSWRW